VAEPTREEICAAIRRRLNARELPRIEGDVFRVYDHVCQRGERLEDVTSAFPGLTMEAAQAAWDTLRAWAEDEA
jgi:uncharacterized protein (DUF433 family)